MNTVVVNGKYGRLAKYAVLVSITACAGIGLSTAFQALHVSWINSYSYSHGYLLLAMCLWLVWLRKMEILRSVGPPSLWGILVLATLMIGYFLTDEMDLAVGRAFLLPLVFLAVAAAIVGVACARMLIPIVSLLCLAIPLWDFLIGPLQRLTASAVSRMLSFTPISAFIEGSRVTTPNGMFEIAEGCSGLHFLLVGSAIAAFYGLAWYQRWPTRVQLFSIAVLVSILANWLRVFVLIVVGDLSQMQHYLIVEDHYVFGWVLFAIMMIPVLWCANQFHASEPRAGVASKELQLPHQGYGSFKMIGFGIACAVLVSSPAYFDETPETPPAIPRTLELNRGIDGWRMIPVSNDWQPAYKRPWSIHRSAFSDSHGRIVDLYVARYDHQQAGSKLIYYGNRLDVGWHVVERTKAIYSLGPSQELRVRESRLISGESSRLIAEWYQVGSNTTQGKVTAKLLEVLALIQGRRDATVVAVSALCSPSCDSARASVTQFLSVAGPVLANTVARRDNW